MQQIRRAEILLELKTADCKVPDSIGSVSAATFAA